MAGIYAKLAFLPLAVPRAAPPCGHERSRSFSSTASTSSTRSVRSRCSGARAAARGRAATLVTLEGAREVTAAHGARICRPRRAVRAAPTWWSCRAAAGSTARRRAPGREAQRGELPGGDRRAPRAGTTVASVCTGALLLAAAGILDGRRATTHHGALDDLRGGGARRRRGAGGRRRRHPDRRRRDVRHRPGAAPARAPRRARGPRGGRRARDRVRAPGGGGRG